MKKTILVFGALSAIIFLIIQIQQWSLFSMSGSEKHYLILSGILFFILGIGISRYFYFKSEVQKRTLKKSSLSNQELKVLQLIAKGYSNREIANHLFIAETTVKSHVSKILNKLDARRRTEAVKIGREMEII